MPSLTEILADKKAAHLNTMQPTPTLVTEAQAFAALDVPTTEAGHKWLRGRITFELLLSDQGEEIRACRLADIEKVQREIANAKASLPPKH